MSIELIQIIYEPGKTLPKNMNFYKEALLEIQYFNVAPQLYFLLKKSGDLERTPKFFQERLKQKYNETLFLNLFIKNQTERLLEEFESEKIDVILLKGTLFAEKYFSQIGARPTSDIDILIKPEHLEQAINLVKLLGFTEDEEELEDHFHRSFSKEIPGSAIPLTVEVHWNLLKESTANLQIKEFWDYAIPMEGCSFIKQLSDYHTFYMICLHGWRHNLDSLKYFIDIIQMIHYIGEKLDYRVLLKDARNHKTYKRMVRTLSIVYDQFPHLNQISYFSDNKTVFFWDFDAFRPSSPKRMKNYLDFIDYIFFSFDTVRHSLVELKTWLMPSKGDLTSELGNINKHRLNYAFLYKKRITNFFKTIFTE